MKIQKKMLVLLLMAFLFSGCAASYHPLVGIIYTENKGPLLVSDNQVGQKVGTATSKVILGVCIGDSSIETAAQNGNITKITSVDTDITSVLGVYVEYTTVVRGN